MDVDRRRIAHSLVDEHRVWLFPLRVNDWRPAIEDWQAKATQDHDTIDTIWKHKDYNIGVRCGRGLLVVDVDDKPGKHGSDSLAKLDLDLEDYDTFTVATPTTGRHFYWEWADVVNSVATAKQALLGPDIDVKSEGGYVVGPGSFLPDGAKNAQGGYYRLIHDGRFRPAPECVTRRLRSPLERVEHTDIPVVDLDQPAAIARAIEHLTRQPLVVERQGADWATYKAAATLKDFGLSEAMTVEVMRAHYKLAPRKSTTDAFIAQKVENAYRYGWLPPGVEHPEHVFRGIHIRPPPLVIPGVRQWFDYGDDWHGSVEWLYQETLPTTGVCLLSGATQSGKTFVSLNLAHSLATGEPFFGTPPEAKGGSILLVGEAYGSVKHRMAGLAVGHNDRLPISSTYVGQLADHATWKALRADLEVKMDQLAQAFSLPVRLLTLDTLSASGILDDENDNAKAARIMRAFADLSGDLGLLALLLHHPPKVGGGQRGASAIPNNADYVMEVLRERNGQLREVEMTKSRDGEQRSLGAFTLQKVELELDDKGRMVTTMKLSVGKGRIKRMRAGPKTEADNTFKEALVWAMENAGAAISWIGKQKVVLLTAVQMRFYETLSEQKNRSRTWERVLDRAEEQQEIVLADKDGRACIMWKEIG